jgi:arylsulfatase
MGKLDNTLIIYIDGDNGTSRGAAQHANQYTSCNGILDFRWPSSSSSTTPGLGGHLSAHGGRVVVGLRHAVQVDKQIASHWGTRQGAGHLVAGPHQDAGGIRTQFHHIIDIVPTILEATGLSAPETVNGIKQKPIEGVSMAYTFDKANANAPSTRHPVLRDGRQPRIYHEGWYATRRRRMGRGS